MKRKLLLAYCLVLAFLQVNARNIGSSMPSGTEKDSIIITFGDKTRLVIYGENRRELENVMQYDLNALLRDLKVRLDSTLSDTTYLTEEFNGNEYLKDRSAEKPKDFVKINLRGIHIKDGDTEVRINGNEVKVSDGDVEVNTESNYVRKGKRFYHTGFGSSPRKGFNIALGLNTYGENEPGLLYNKDDYDLKPFGSRYISLGYVASARLVKGKTQLHLDFGIDFSWYNFMFDGNNTVSKSDERVEFTPVKNELGEVQQMKKSKLTVPYVNLSFMPTLSFSRSFISYISAGVYGGYRLGSYTKLKVEGSKDVDHVRQNFYVQDFRYGLSAELGIRNFPDLFVNYDLNNFYETGKGPGVKVLSFGIRLF